MKLFQSIRFRIVVACISFSLIVTLGYGWVTFYGVKYNSDELFNWYIAEEAGELISLYHQDSSLDLGGMTTAKIMISRDVAVLNELSQYFASQSNKAKLTKATSLDNVSLPGPRFTTEQGYTIYEFTGEGKTLHILKAPLHRNETQHFYYIVNVSDFVNYDNLSEQYIADIFLRILIFIIILALLVGFFLSQMVLSPLTRLANSVDEVAPHEYVKHKQGYYNDEIGFLAKKIDAFVARTNQFVLREKAFSRDASHELRTPVASSRAALELAMATPEGQSQNMDKYLQRIDRANRDMTHLIETFLMLGKEETEHLKDVKFNLSSVVSRAFEKHDYLKKSPDILCINDVDQNIHILGQEQLLSIVINNLVRNAFQHTSQGAIRIDYQNDQLIVQDSGEGMKLTDNDDRSTSVLEKSGVGLSLVRRLSEMQGWQVNIDSELGEGTTVSIKLS